MDITAKVLEKEALLRWVDSLKGVIGPVKEGNQVIFRPIKSSLELELDYGSTMIPPTAFICPPQETLLKFTQNDEGFTIKESLSHTKQVLLGVHPCDINAVLFLDKVFYKTKFPDPYYVARRKNTFLIALNCTQVSENCFCASMGTGPFLDKGYNLLLTDLGDRYLVELRQEEEIVASLPLKDATTWDMEGKAKREKMLKDSFTKKLDIENLPALLKDNLDHPVWYRVGESECLSCTNCTMVCPTCYCYNVVDRTDLDLKNIERYRYWDSCQDLYFAEVHGGNFRSTREARLRQFVCHKLSYIEQYNCFGCVGCGRCITWCPTNIDLTEIAKGIQTNARKSA
jgi:ferredoxin